jgi:outer membrane receptor for ferrienterochelin and colicins
MTYSRILMILTVCLMMCHTNLELSAHNKKIKGRVIVNNGENNPVVGATVRLEGTVLGAISDHEGRFIIRNIPDGTYTMIVSSVGMKTQSTTLDLEHVEGDELLLDFELVENPIVTSSVVVTATRSEKIYDDVPVKVSTLTNADIDITSSTNIRESLQFQPGVRTEVNCQNCGFSQVRINGLEGKYSQILIDGKALYSSLNGVYGLEQIPTNMIDRIEVIRGGGSSLYGGNAIAGVVNIITKDPCYNTFDVSWTNMLIDNKYPENLLNMNASIISDDQNMGLSLFGMLNDRHEYDANGDGFTEIGRLDVKTFGTKMFWNLTSKSKIEAEVHTIHHKIRGGNLLDLPAHESDITEFAEHETLLAQLSYKQYIGDASTLNVYASGQATNRDSYYGAEQDPNAYGSTDNNTYAIGANFTHAIDEFLGYHIITVGYEYNYDFMNDKAPAYDRVIDQKVYTNGLFFQDDWSISENIDLLWGARLDKHNLIDNPVINPRASLLVKPLDDLSIRATYSTGYRAPQAFDEDLHITQVGGEAMVILLNDDLKPEYSHSFSASADYSMHLFDLPLAFSLEYFYTDLKDVFILEDQGIDDQSRHIMLRDNGESANVSGITFELQSVIRNDFTLKVGLTYQKSIYSEDVEWSSGDEEAGTEAQFSDKILKTPDLYGYLVGSIKIIDDLMLDLSAYFTGKMYVPHYAGYIESDVLEETNQFIDASVKLSYEIWSQPDISLQLGAHNILNQYQSDFDMGIDRDAGYIYGPFRPFTTTFGISVGY